MLLIPDKGVSRSIKEHNSKLNHLADWVEGSAIFFEQRISQSDVLDTLIDEEIYEDQDFAREYINIIWEELKRRKNIIGKNYPFEITNNEIFIEEEETNFVCYTFCLLLSLSSFFSKIRLGSGPKKNNYIIQGELFEKISESVLKIHLHNWDVHRTGWSTSNTNSFEVIVQDIVLKLGENLGDLDLWNDPNAKEKGVDLLLYKKFRDERAGLPIYLIQCASGNDWSLKLSTPELNIWNDVICFTSKPRKSFTMPFVLEDRDFKKVSKRIDGIFFDRCRLLGINKDESEWVHKDLKRDLIDFIDSKKDLLPTLEE